jgi:hypothetical protein
MSVSREKVLQVLLTSRKSETAVGLRIKGRNHLLITMLEHVGGTSSDNTVLIVNPESIYGETLPGARFYLDQIDQIFNLRISYHDPFYQYLRKLRTNIKTIREEVGIHQKATSY